MENYEQKYKEALERAKYLKENTDSVGALDVSTCFEKIFPELNDSEDERIRKELIERFKWELKGAEEQDAAGCSRQKDIAMFKRGIAWLEKQDIKLQEYIDEERNKKDFYCEGKEMSWNEIPLDVRKHDYPYYFKDGLDCFPFNAEKQGEQKPADKVEPKFKDGDWVRAISSGNIFKILSFNDGLYRVLCYDGVEANYPIEVEKDLTHWTIQDAKDGDVLATKKGNPFIYDKNRYNNGLAYYYAGLDVNKELTLKSPHHMLAHFGELCSIFPATKEQRDLLFQKMKEAGYEWNAEKKELIEIEKQSEHKSAWSEEDEKIINDAIWLIEHYATDGHKKLLREQTIDKLKSINPKSHWKPSEEQMEALFEAKLSSINNREYFLGLLYEDLKKL